MGIICLWPSEGWGLGQPLNLTPAERQNLEEAKGKVPGEVVFASRRDGKWRLFRINADGTNLSRLSLGLANYTRPEFVDEGQRLIYHSDENGPVQIFLANPDLSGTRCLSPPAREEHFAGISQSHIMMVYSPGRGYVLRPLTGGPEVPLVLPVEMDEGPGHYKLRLAPSGRRVLAVQPIDDNDLGHGQIFLLTLNPQSGRTSLDKNLGSGDFASWRADSEALVFVRPSAAGQAPGTAVWFWEEGGQEQQLSDDMNWNIYTSFALRGPGLVWSKAPLFTRDPASGRYDIWLQRENGKTLRLTQHSAPDLSPTWREQVGAPLHQGVDFIYEAYEYATFRAVSAADAESPGGEALASILQVEPGLLFATAPEVVPPGLYQARFRLKLVQGPARQPLARLEVSTGQKILASHEISAESFANKGYNIFPLQFRLDHLSTGLSLHLYSLSDQAVVHCDVVSLQSNAPAPWYAPVLELWREWTK